MRYTRGMEYSVTDHGVWVGYVKRDALTRNAPAVCTHWCVYQTAFRADLIGRDSILFMWYTTGGEWQIEEWAKHNCRE